jgi:pyruvate dehydrogenase (quinone)
VPAQDFRRRAHATGNRLADAWDRALTSDRPVVLEAITDPNVPTLPPHITLKQARNFATSLIKGDPDEGGILKQAIKGLVQGLVPHGGDPGK